MNAGPPESPILPCPWPAPYAFVRVMTLSYLAPDELSSAAESALVHRLLEDGDNPNDWTVSYVWASDSEQPVYAVVLEGEEGVRAFTVAPLDDCYDVMEVTDG